MTREESAILDNLRTIAALAESPDDHRDTIARIARAALKAWGAAHLGAGIRAREPHTSHDSKKGGPRKTR